MSDTRTEGTIDRIEVGEEDRDIVWGTFEDGRTFDLPVQKHIHNISDRVCLTTVADREEIGSDHVIVIYGYRHATVYWCDNSPDGLEIVHDQIYSRSIH